MMSAVTQQLFQKPSIASCRINQPPQSKPLQRLMTMLRELTSSKRRQRTRYSRSHKLVVYIHINEAHLMVCSFRFPFLHHQPKLPVYQLSNCSHMHLLACQLRSLRMTIPRLQSRRTPLKCERQLHLLKLYAR